MRKFFLLFVASFLSLAVSCSKDEVEGPEGPQGVQGEQGPKGDQGDPGPSAQKFTVRVNADQWSKGAHYGSLNVFSYYSVPMSAIGNLSMANPNYMVIVYAVPQQTGYSQLRAVPHTYVVDDNYRLTLDVVSSSNEVIMYKSVDGIQVRSVPLNERPDKVDFIIYFIDVAAVQQMSGKIDFSDYGQVSRYFDL